jgi:hypothetical protein
LFPRAGWRRQGLEIPTPERQTPQALGVYQKAEIGKRWPMLRAAGIKAQ